MPPVRRLTAILAADVAGYSRLMGTDEEGTHERLKAHLGHLVEPKIKEHRGHTVKNTGDGLLAEFSSVVDAVRCAVEVQRGMADRNIETPEDKRITFRIGVNLGDVIVEEHDIFGDGVNVAARLEGLAELGGVCISRVVRDQIRDKLPYPFEDRGEQSVKNIIRSVRVYALRPEAVSELPISGTPIAAPRRQGRIISVIAAVATVLILSVVAWWVWPMTGSSPTSSSRAANTAILQPVVPPRLSIVVLPFANLSNGNARDAMPEGGVLTIATRNVALGAGGTLSPGDYVAVRVADTGTGMMPELIAHAFEPFFTTKEPGAAPGLACHRCTASPYNPAAMSEIQSKPGEGTTVTLLLPRAKSLPIAVQPDAGSTGQATRRRTRILVVDDDRDVRQMTGEMLTERGYSVELAAAADEALAILQRDGGFDAMLVDYVMPGTNGASLAKIVRNLRPGMGILMMTGHAELQAGEEIGTENIIRKPFNVATLNERLVRVLARPIFQVVQGVVGAGAA